MPIVINGSGSINGVSVGGLPDGCVDADTLAGNAVTSAKILDGTIASGDVNDLAASKLTGALPAISGASLTGVSTSNLLNMETESVATKRFSTNSWVDQNSYTYTCVDGNSQILVTVHHQTTLHFWGGADDDAMYALQLLRVSPSAATIAKARQWYEYPNDQVGGGNDLSSWVSSGGPWWKNCVFTMSAHFSNPASSGNNIVFKTQGAMAAASVFDIDTTTYTVWEFSQ